MKLDYNMSITVRLKSRRHAQPLHVDIAHFEKKKHRNILSNVPAQLYQGGDIRVYFVRLGQRSPEYMWEACAEAESFFFNLCSRKMATRLYYTCNN